MEKIFLITLLISILALSNTATKEKVEDLFNGLYSGEVYSGYLQTTIPGDELFYIYMPSQNQDPNAPLMLWLNGGPGCSSLFGLLAEIGPVSEDNFVGKYEVNPYSWNKEVNLLAIEQPAGVGFSKASDPKFNWTDDLMAENLMAGIKDFLNEFNLKEKDFYVSGESYAGVYIPYLAKYILNDKSEDKINLKGVLIGNGLTDFDVDVERSMVEFGFWHGMISSKTFNLFKKHCLHKPDELHPEENTNEINDGYFPRNVTHRCNEIREIISNNLKGSDIYGIYRECPLTEKINKENPLYLNSQNTYRKTILKKLKEKNNDKKLNEGLEPENDVFPELCEEDMFVDEFLNLNEVKNKLKVFDPSIRWVQCNGNLNYELGNSFDFYSETMKQFPDLKVWVFSGTEDGVLPTLGTMRWINKLNLTIEKKWKQYYDDNKQVCGYAQQYKEGLVIVTVKGAGHMVPQDKRAAAYKMYSSFIKGVLPSEVE
jgi:carboxypeptidase C (cathepsin A)